MVKCPSCNKGDLLMFIESKIGYVPRSPASGTYVETLRALESVYKCARCGAEFRKNSLPFH